MLAEVLFDRIGIHATELIPVVGQPGWAATNTKAFGDFDVFSVQLFTFATRRAFFDHAANFSD